MTTIRPATRDDLPAWGAMRSALFDTLDDEYLQLEMLRFLEDDRQACFLALEGERAVGFVEMSLRNFVDGCLTSPVAYIEGLYVDDTFRGRGAGRKLVERGVAWGLERGCTEFATDSLLGDERAQAFHRHMGFEETYRIVQFKLRRDE